MTTQKTIVACLGCEYIGNAYHNEQDHLGLQKDCWGIVFGLYIGLLVAIILIQLIHIQKEI